MNVMHFVKLVPEIVENRNRLSFEGAWHMKTKKNKVPFNFKVKRTSPEIFFPAISRQPLRSIHK